MSALNFNITKIELMHLAGPLPLPECSGGAETTEVEACMATYSLFVCAATDHERQAAHGRYKFRSAVVEVASGKNHA